MAVLDYYVDTAAAAGGNGTTPALSGATCAFNSLAAALLALAQNLVTAGNSIVIHCAASAGAADTTAPSFTGWTTDPTHYLTIQVDPANRHAGIWAATKYRVEGSFQPMFTAPPAYTRFVALQAMCSADDVNTPIWRAGGTGTDKSAGCRIISCIARWTDKNYTYGSQRILDAGTDQITAPWIVANLLAYGGVGTHGRSPSYAILATNSFVNVYNSTLIGFGAGSDAAGVAISDGHGTVKAVNVISQGWASFGNPGAAGTDYNAADVASVPGAHSRSSQTFTFVDAANAKYQLASADAGAKGFGTDLSTDATYPFADDIAGTTRTTPWDIGAFVAQSSGASVSATGTAGQGGGASGSATQRTNATGSAGEGEAASGSATTRLAATGSAGEAGGATANATAAIAGTGSAGSGASASGAATTRISATGTAGEGGAATAAGSQRVDATGTAGEAQSAQGAATQPGAGSASGSAGSGAGASGSATTSTTASGSAGAGESVRGAATGQLAGSGTAGEGERASGTATQTLAGTGTAGSAAAAAGAASETAPGAPTVLRTRVTMSPAVHHTTQMVPTFRHSASMPPRFRTATSLLPS